MTGLAGFVKECGALKSGVNTLYLAQKDWINLFDPHGSIDSTYEIADMKDNPEIVEPVTPYYFKKYEFDRDTAEFKEGSVEENGAIKITQDIEFHIGKMSQDQRDAVAAIMDASSCGIVALVVMNFLNNDTVPEDRVNEIKVVGYDEEQLLERPLRLKSAEASTGKKLTDASGETVTLSRETTMKCWSFIGDLPIEPVV